MTERQLAHVLFRVLGLWMIAQSVAHAGAVYSGWATLYEKPSASELAALLAPMALALATGVVVWAWAGSLAAAVFREAPGPDGASSPSVSAGYRAAVSVMGLYLLVTAIPSAVSWLGVWIQERGGGILGAHEQSLSITAKAELAATLAQCLLGALLYVGPQRLLAWSRQSFSSRLSEEDVDP